MANKKLDKALAKYETDAEKSAFCNGGMWALENLTLSLGKTLNEKMKAKK